MLSTISPQQNRNGYPTTGIVPPASSQMQFGTNASGAEDSTGDRYIPAIPRPTRPAKLGLGSLLLLLGLGLPVPGQLNTGERQLLQTQRSYCTHGVQRPLWEKLLINATRVVNIRSHPDFMIVRQYRYDGDRLSGISFVVKDANQDPVQVQLHLKCDELTYPWTAPSEDPVVNWLKDRLVFQNAQKVAGLMEALLTAYPGIRSGDLPSEEVMAKALITEGFPGKVVDPSTNTEKEQQIPGLMALAAQHNIPLTVADLEVQRPSVKPLPSQRFLLAPRGLWQIP